MVRESWIRSMDDNVLNVCLTSFTIQTLQLLSVIDVFANYETAKLCLKEVFSARKQLDLQFQGNFRGFF